MKQSAAPIALESPLILNGRGLPPISGGSGVGEIIEQDGAQVRVLEVDAEGNPTSTEPVAPAPAPTVETVEQRLARLEAENARLAGRLDEATRRETAPTPPPAPTTDTPEAVIAAHRAGRMTYGAAAVQIDELYKAGRLTDRGYQEAITDLRTRQNFLDEERQRLGAQQQTTVRDRMRELFKAHPDLKVEGSALVLDVAREIDDLVKTMGYDAEDLRTQVLAIERVVGRPATPSAHEFDRLRRPVSTGPGGAAPSPAPKPSDKSRGQQLYERMNAESQAFFLAYHGNNLAQIYSALNHADEGVLTRAGRFAR